MRQPELKLLFILMFFLIFPGCKQPIENPETIDPIYRDLVDKASGFSKDSEEQQKKIEDLTKSIEKEPSKSAHAIADTKELRKAELLFAKFSQLAQFYKIRAERRKFSDREDYAKAFNNDQTWPDPQEFKFYKINEALRNAPKSWDSHLPKLPEPPDSKSLMSPGEEVKKGGGEGAKGEE